jgi:hypothetical protein
MPPVRTTDRKGDTLKDARAQFFKISALNPNPRETALDTLMVEYTHKKSARHHITDRDGIRRENQRKMAETKIGCDFVISAVSGTATWRVTKNMAASLSASIRDVITQNPSAMRVDVLPKEQIALFQGEHPFLVCITAH